MIKFSDISIGSFRERFEESKIEVIPVENIDEVIRPALYDGKDKMI